MKLWGERRVRLLVNGEEYVLGPRDSITIRPTTTLIGRDGQPCGLVEHSPIRIRRLRP